MRLEAEPVNDTVWSTFSHLNGVFVMVGEAVPAPLIKTFYSAD